MGVKGQSKMLVPAVGLALAIAFFVVNLFVIEYTIQVGENELRRNYASYESTTYGYIFSSDGENFLLTGSELDALKDSGCELPGFRDRKLYIMYEEDPKRCYAYSGNTPVLDNWVENQEIISVFSARTG